MALPLREKLLENEQRDRVACTFFQECAEVDAFTIFIYLFNYDTITNNANKNTR